MSEQTPQTSDAPVTSTPSQSSAVVRALVGLFVLIVLAGGVMFWRISHQYGPAHAVAEQFLRDMSAGNAKAAEGLCTSDVDFPALERMSAKQHQMWGELRDVKLEATRASTINGKPCTDISGTLAYEHVAEEAFGMSIVQLPDGNYRIAAYHFEAR